MKLYTGDRGVIEYKPTDEDIVFVSDLDGGEQEKLLQKNDFYKNTNLRFREFLYIVSQHSNGKILRNWPVYYLDAVKLKNKIYFDRKDNKIDFELNTELVNAVKYGMQKNYETAFERIIYYYFKLCYLLNFDVPYAFVQFINKNAVAHYKKRIDRLNDIDFYNNNVSCYEFAAIFNKFINMEGCITDDILNREYGVNKHITSICIIDDVVFEFDPLSNGNDYRKVKAQESIINENGDFTCGICQWTYSEYEDVIREKILSVYEDVKEEIKLYPKTNKYTDDKISFLMNIVEHLNISEIKKNKLKKYLLQMISLPLSGIDYVGYVNKYIVNDLNEEFNNEIFLINLCSTINYCGFDYIVAIKLNDKYIYIKMDEYNNIDVLDKEELEKLFKELHLISVSKKDLIPGIDEKIQKDSNKRAFNEVIPNILDEVKTGKIYKKI